MKGSIHDNIQRYSMPSAGLYDLVTGLLFRGRYREIARAIAAEASDGWDIASPHEDEDESARDAAHGNVSHDIAPADAHPSLLGTVRMMLQFRRIPFQRYEFTKPA